MVFGVGSKIISTMGNPSSKLPLAIKDVANSLGYTYFSYDAGGKVEGKDRFIDEFGTMAIWLGGIPFFRKIIDKTLYKAAKLSPDVDIRVAANANRDYLKLAIENAPTDKIKENMVKAASPENIGKFKKLYYGKFAAATLLTMGAYLALTKVKQHITKKEIEKNFIKGIKEGNDQFLTNTYASNPVFKSIKESKTIDPSKAPKPAFGAIPQFVESFMFSPVKNMLLVDAGITTERLSHSRTKGEFKEYAIKEGSFLFFVYYAGKHIQRGIEKLSEKLFDKPIKLDAKFLASESLKETMQNKTIKDQLQAFGRGATDTDIYKFIFANPDNLVVKAAKDADIVKTVKVAGKDLIDSSKYISVKKVRGIAAELGKLANSFEASSETVQKYLSKTKGLKVLSTALNIGICCLALGYVVPKLMYKARKKDQNGNTDFHVKQAYEQELSQQLRFGKLKAS